MLVKLSELQKDKAMLLSAIGATIFEYQINDFIKTILISEIRYRDCEVSQVLINHRV